MRAVYAVRLRPAAHGASLALFERLLARSAALGYDAYPVQPRHGRFAVHARYGGDAGYVMAVECSREGYVVITPAGPGVQTHGGVYYVPAQLRAELGAFARALEQVVLDPARSD